MFALLRLLARHPITSALTCVGKSAVRLYDDIHAEFFPRQSRWILLIEHHDDSTVELDHPFSDFDVAREYSISRIITTQVGVGDQIGHVIDGHDNQLLFVAFEHGLQTYTANGAETINRYF